MMMSQSDMARTRGQYDSNGNALPLGDPANYNQEMPNQKSDSKVHDDEFSSPEENKTMQMDQINGASNNHMAGR